MDASEAEFDSFAEELFADYLVRCEREPGLEFEAYCREHAEHAEALRALNALWGSLDSLRRKVDESLASGPTPTGRATDSPAAPSSAPPSAIDLEDRSKTRGSSGLLDRLRTRTPQSTRYRIGDEIARGGMGAILNVWDEELRRELAMKVMLGRKGGSSGPAEEVDPSLLSRFLEEAQVTGQLDHPGIVPVHELGLDSDGRVFFTMRLVKGENLRAVFEHVKAGRGGWSLVRALGVLLRACEAMSYAHDKGVIHRDLKPSNVMVGKFGEVYVMDWGLARVSNREDKHDLRLSPSESFPSAISTDRHQERDLTPDSPLVTMDGTVVGTASYMPPEQAKGQIEKLGPHSDVYSIGAMLYELVSGEVPYSPSGLTPSRREILKAVIEGPPSPVEQVAGHTPPELIAIIEKAMARKIRARYSTTIELAEDLRSYLEGHVVAAYETGAWAEAKKWVQRNKALSIALATAILAIIAGVIAFGLEAKRANRHAMAAMRNAEEADANATRAEQVTQLVQAALISSDPNQGGSQEYRVVEAMEAAVRELEGGALTKDPQTEAALQATISVILRGNGRAEEALRLAQHALDTRRVLLPNDHPDVSASLTEMANCLSDLGRSAGALRLHREALDMDRRRASGDNPSVASDLNNIAASLQELGRADEALVHYEAALEMRQRLFEGNHPDLATSLGNLGSALSALGRPDEALPYYEAARDMHTKLFGADHPRIAASLNNVAYCLVTLGRSSDALPLYEDALSMHQRIFRGDHPLVATSLANLGFCLNSLGRIDEALEWDTRALEMRQRLYDGDHPDLAMGLANLAARLHQLRRYEEALPKFEAALEMSERLRGGDHPEVAVHLSNLAGCLKALDRAGEALPMFEAALSMSERLFPDDHPSVATNLSNTASCWLALGQGADALMMYGAALEMRKRLFSDPHPRIAEDLNNLASCLQSLGRDEDALAAYEEALEICEKLYDDDHPLQATILAHLADCLFNLGRAAEARPHAERALTIVRQLPSVSYPSPSQVHALIERISASLLD